jgi:acyl phosphate:glycerol-3-phosphate acyltransferase
MTALFVIAAYLLGSVPFGVVLTRLLTGKDVREVGSGNIGASNVTRAAGKVAGVLTLVLDAAKAAIPMLLALRHFAGQGRATADGWAVAVGLAAFAGHLYPVWLGFKGGKGVATALGVFAVLAPIPVLVAVVVFALAFVTTRVPAIGSLVGTLVCCAGAWIQEFRDQGSAAWSSPVPWAALVVTIVIVLRHRANIERLLKGKEHKV